MKCYSLLLGARNSRTKHFSRRDDALVRKITQSYFPSGFTILNARGGWFDPTRSRFVREESRQVLICADNRKLLGQWCNELGRALGQKELLVVEQGAALTFHMS